MKIYFVGSLNSFYAKDLHNPATLSYTFGRLGFNLGVVAARRRHIVLLGGDKPSTIDHHVFSGCKAFASDNPATEVSVEYHRPQGIRAPFSNFPANLKVISRPYPEPITDPWVIPRLGAIERCDAVVTVGGKEGTSIAGTLALHEKKTLIPIACFDGVSKELLEVIKYQLSPGDFDRFLNWRDDDVDTFFSSIERLSENNEATRERNINLSTPHRYFISYCHGNAAQADHVEALIRRFQRQVSRDECALAVSAPLSRGLGALIETSDTYIGLVSKRFLSSDWCMKEWDFATAVEDAKRKRKEKFRIAILHLDNSDLPVDMTHSRYCRGQKRDQRELAIRKLLEEENI